MTAFMEQNHGQSPTEEQLMEIDGLVAQFIAEEMQNMKQLSMQIANMGQPQGPDPLVQLKEKELQIKAQDSQADITQDQAELQLDREKETRKGQEFQQRLQSQEGQTQARIQSAMDREVLKLRNKGQ